MSLLQNPPATRLTPRRTNGVDPAGHAAPSASDAASEKRLRARTLARQQQAAERIPAAATHLASGVTEAMAASQELSQSMEMIAKGANRAAGASEESMAAATQSTAG